MYPHWFLLPGAAVYAALFIIPSFASFYFAFTRWTFFDVTFIGFDNFVTFFNDPQLSKAFTNTLIYGALTSVLKVVLGLGLGMLFTSDILAEGTCVQWCSSLFWSSTVGVGITFQALLDPFDGVMNNVLAIFGIDGPGWLTNPDLVLYSIIGIDVWKGRSCRAHLHGRSRFDPARVLRSGEGRWCERVGDFRFITLPFVRPATTTVVILSLIGGLRSFEIIWATTGGGPVSPAMSWRP